jgi:lipoprotein-releasing system permease protein
MKFEFFVANRYLRARRKEAVISVITFISVLGVAAGVMALVISLAINNGFRSTLQRNLLGATAHVNVMTKQSGEGIENWKDLTARLAAIPHVTAAAPVLYGQVFLSGPAGSKGVILKGINPDSELRVSDTLRHLKQGSLDRLADADGLPGIIIGSRMADETGMTLDSNVMVISPQGTLTPLGARPGYKRFRVAGIFESGFYDLDDNWTYAAMPTVQKILSLPNVVNSIELHLDDIYLAPQIASEAEKLAGPRFGSTTWQEQNKQILKALNMERIVTVITIGLIELVAALNILITLVMMVMEKYRDIAILISMGARRNQIRRIFMIQGLLIGAVGTTIGLIAGYAFCYIADHYRLIQLDAQVYALSFVPFEPRWTDGLWVAAVALVVSFCATLYPARNATRIAPVEVLRYE